MANDVCLINGVAYSWRDVKVRMLNRTVQGITAISYEQAQEKADNPGQGHYATSRGYGQKTANGSITLDLKEWAALIKAVAPGKDLTDIAWFPIIVTFVNSAGEMEVHRLEKCEFLKQGIDQSTGKTRTETTIPLIIGRIHFKAA